MKHHKKNRNPEDAKDEILIKEVDTWKFSFSKSQKCIFIDTTSYHPFKLKLTKNDLLELIGIIDETEKG